MSGSKEKTHGNVSMKFTQTSNKTSISHACNKDTEISMCSDTSCDSGGLAEELDTTRKHLQDLPTRKDVDSLKQSFVLLNDFQNDIANKISDLKEEYENKIKGIEMVNESLAKEIKSLKELNAKLKTDRQTTSPRGN